MTQVRQFRQALLWPLRLMPVEGSRAPAWHALRQLGPACPWREVVDEYTGGADGFQERHYREFVAFLPYVQRFLYGEGRAGRHDGSSGTPMRVFRRSDIAKVRMAARAGDTPVTLDVSHVDLYFFFDVDMVILNVEVSASDIPFEQVQALLYRFGRGYPGGWDADGQAVHCMASVEWLAADGMVLSQSDAQESGLFLSHVFEHRAPRISSHWAFALHPLVADHSAETGQLRFRQIEYYRMPVMAWLALDDPQALKGEDFAQLGFTGDFEKRYCYDRFWTADGDAPHTRYVSNGHAFIVLGSASSSFYACGDRGVLAQFRHQHFLLFLIAHFQKAALLMFSDRLAQALMGLEVGDPASVRRFKRAIRASFEAFLRFTHRYWFHEISEQAHVRALWRMCAQHLDLDPLYAEVKERIEDMNGYLDADSLRRQANTVVRLTVVTIFGLIGTVTTGFLGMNLIAEAEASAWKKLLYFLLVFVPTISLTFYTIVKSKGLSDFLDALSDERLGWREKFGVLAAVWGKRQE